MDPNKENNKSWKRVGYFSTYEEAQARKSELHAEHTVDDDLIIKIRRCGLGGTRYMVKYWHPDFVKPKNNKKKNKRPDSSAG